MTRDPPSAAGLPLEPCEALRTIAAIARCRRGKARKSLPALRDCLERIETIADTALARRPAPGAGPDDPH